MVRDGLLCKGGKHGVGEWGCQEKKPHAVHTCARTFNFLDHFLNIDLCLASLNLAVIWDRLQPWCKGIQRWQMNSIHFRFKSNSLKILLSKYMAHNPELIYTHKAAFLYSFHLWMGILGLRFFLPHA